MQKMKSIDTRAVHAGDPSPRIAGAVAMPIFQSSTFEYEDDASYHDIRYIRLNNTPNHIALHKKLADLEGTEAAVVTASGMAAIATTLLAVLKTGDHVLAQSCLYGGTHALITHDLAQLGITVDFIDAADPSSWSKQLKSNTRLVYVEAMTNPLLAVADHGAVVAFAKAHKLVSVVDNTFTTPVNFRPAELGFDLSVHSGTKYLNGHSDIVAGAVLGSKDWIEQITHKLNHFGGSLDPHACFLLERGLKTLALRVARQNSNGLSVARFLEQHAAVARVHYPGLETSPHFKRARTYFDGFGGVVSFKLKGGLAAAKKLIRTLEIPVHAASLGGVESLILLPALSTHQQMTPTERAAIGLPDDLIRLSLGIEAADDLIADLGAALAGADNG